MQMGHPSQSQEPNVSTSQAVADDPGARQQVSCLQSADHMCFAHYCNTHDGGHGHLSFACCLSRVPSTPLTLMLCCRHVRPKTLDIGILLETVVMWLQQTATVASAVAAGLPAAAAYQASSLVVRLSVKLFNCTPGDLPQGLREQLCSWLCATPAGAEGYIRPGCLHLTMQVPGPSYAAACPAVLAHAECEVLL